MKHVGRIFVIYLVNLIVMDIKIKYSIDFGRLLKELKEKVNENIKRKPKDIYL